MDIGHQPPDYPIMNLEVAQRGRRAHQTCDTETCPARAYFDKVAARLAHQSEPPEPPAATPINPPSM
ncbi:hypothetical protein ACFVUS_09940 [Nocardia sp. NPDC058058]|uniref:hypothetical protein n=1 Tax=Nocardia sp. NPDC058058 TaxID=3346317 RepID=UPI0036DCFBD9